ncbi:MAG: GNAT family N-acetyltransferase [Thermostichus sp. HHBFW_bins_43]
MSSAVVKFRPATLEDLELLQRWDQEPHIVASDPNDDWGWETELGKRYSWREQWMAEVDGLAIGFVQIIDPAQEESHYWGEVSPHLRAIDIWIGEGSHLGKGYGTQMMQLALKRCFADPQVEAVLVDPLVSNIRARRFYERLGFKPMERRQFGLDECMVYRLEREDWVN